MMLAYFSYLVMGLHLKCSQKLIKVFVFPVINPCAVNKISSLTYNIWSRGREIGHGLSAGGTTLSKGVYVGYVLKKTNTRRK
jgi:hypothetical protein